MPTQITIDLPDTITPLEMEQALGALRHTIRGLDKYSKSTDGDLSNALRLRAMRLRPLEEIARQVADQTQPQLHMQLGLPTSTNRTRASAMAGTTTP